MDGNIKPKIIDNLSDIYKELERKGLSKEMIVTLIQNKTKLGKSAIRKMIDALLSLEKEIEINLAKRLPDIPHK